MTRLTLVVLAVIGLVAWRLSVRQRPVRESPAQVRPLAASAPAPAAPVPTKSLSGPPAARPRLASAVPEIPALDLSTTLPGGVDLVSDWETLPLDRNPAPIEAWPGWKCADLSDNTGRSLWIREDAEEKTGEVHPGTCSEWASRGPGDPTIWAPPDGGETYPIPGS